MAPHQTSFSDFTGSRSTGDGKGVISTGYGGKGWVGVMFTSPFQIRLFSFSH